MSEGKPKTLDRDTGRWRDKGGKFASIKQPTAPKPEPPKK